MAHSRRSHAFLFVTLLSAVAVPLAPSAVSAQASQASPRPAPSPETPDLSFPAEVQQVVVDVVVTDKKGSPITGLKAADFAVSEDGKPQPITSFEAIQLPERASEVPPPKPRLSSNQSPEAHAGRTFAIVFDDVHMAPFQAHRAKAAVAEFLKSGVREGDRVTLAAAGGGAWWSTRMEAGRDELITLLKRLDGRRMPDMAPDRMSDYEAMRIHVYGDAQVEARVARRFETFGVNPGSTYSNQSNSGLAMDGDPMVRGRAADVYFQAVSRNRITLEVMERVLGSLQGVKGRKSLVLVSEGFIYDPNLDEFKRVIESSRRANAAIYFLDTRGLGGLSVYASAQFGPALPEQDLGSAFMETLDASEGSESLAADSGGFSVKNTNDLARGITRIAAENRVYYLLGYTPTNTDRDGRFRKIQVKVPGRKSIEVRARKGYYAPGLGKTALDKKPGGADPKIQQALDSPYEFSEIPLRMTSFVFDETLLGKASVIVNTDVDIRGFAFEEKQDRLSDTLEFLLVVAHRESGEFFRYDQKVDMNLKPETRERFAASWFPIARDFELAPGGYQAKIVVRDKNSGRVGTVIHEFDVPELTSFRLSTPIVTDVLVQGEAGEDRPRPQMLARRAFSPAGMLFCQFDVYGAAKDKATHMPRVSASYEIKAKDGRLVASVPASQIQPTSLGKLSRIVGSPIEGIEPGDYELVLSIRDEIAGKTIEAREPFVVVPPGAPKG
ncbi:MAG: VWA domain-containing protein [Vicinamibacteria bacterium]